MLSFALLSIYSQLTMMMKKSGMFVLMYLICMSAILAQAEFYKPKTTVPDNKDEMIEKAETFLNGIFEGNIDASAALMHDEFYQFPPGAGQDSLSKEESLKEMTAFSKTWKDVKWNGISTCVSNEEAGNTVVFLWGMFSATQIESGKEISFSNHAVCLFSEGKIVRLYQYYDTATVSKQLGFKMVPIED